MNPSPSHNTPSASRTNEPSTSSTTGTQSTKRPRLDTSSAPGGCKCSGSTTPDNFYQMIFPPAMGISQYVEPSDQRILEWQEHQLSSGMIENTVNLMVERFAADRDREAAESAAAPAVAPDQPTFDQSAIQMAINEHGLQQQQHAANAPNMFFVVNTQDDERGGGLKWSRRHTQCATSPPVVEDNDDEQGAGLGHKDAVAGEAAERQSVDNDDEHFNFMEAAVAVAIQKKGLTTPSPGSTVNNSQ